MQTSLLQDLSTTHETFLRHVRHESGLALGAVKSPWTHVPSGQDWRVGSTVELEILTAEYTEVKDWDRRMRH